MIPDIIGLAGRKGHGKDTLGKIIAQDRQSVRVAFADALKLEAAKHLGIRVHVFDDPCHKETLRPYLVALGMTRRYLNPSHWIGASGIAEQARTGKRFHVTDVRFPDEMAAIRKLGGIVLFVRGVGLPLADDNPMTNIAEQLMPEDCDGVIDNDFTPEGLRGEWDDFCLCRDRR